MYELWASRSSRSSGFELNVATVVYVFQSPCPILHFHSIRVLGIELFLS